MPELDGFETTKRIRAFNPNIPIVALTAASSEEVMAKISLYGIDGLVLKPFATEDLISILKEAMLKRGQAFYI